MFLNRRYHEFSSKSPTSYFKSFVKIFKFLRILHFDLTSDFLLMWHNNETQLYQVKIVSIISFLWIQYSAFRLIHQISFHTKLNLFLVSHLRLSQQKDDPAEGQLNHFIVITLNQQQPCGLIQQIRPYKKI